MRFRQALVLPALLLAPVFAQQPDDTPGAAPPVIRAETRLVLVDAVVTDKKGNYLRDLKAKDFHVFEDDKEQKVNSFSFEGDPLSPTNDRKHYLVLFFDNSTMQSSDQLQARRAATQFIDANVGPDRLMAVVDFSGTLRIRQNFTGDAALLKKAAGGLQGSTVASNPDLGVAGSPRLAGLENQVGQFSGLLALRNLVKNLAPIPGRKTLVLITAGFPVTSSNLPELNALVDACNKANVAIYPVDVRGLVALNRMPRTSSEELAVTRPVSYSSFAFGFQQGGRGGGASTTGGAAAPSTGGRGATGSAPSTAPAGGRGGTATVPSSSPSTPGNLGRGGANVPAPTPSRTIYTPNNIPRPIIPPFPINTQTNQQALYVMAEGTGGFVILNTNDLLGGMGKIAQEQNEYYLLGYTPPPANDSKSCHTLKVKVERSGATVRARSGYCNVKPRDVLTGKPVEKDLETRAAATQPGIAGVSMKIPYFYTAPNKARVDLALEIPTDSINFEKDKGRFHAVLNVLGLAYPAIAKAGTEHVAVARFSDSLDLYLTDKKDVDKFKEGKYFRYENQFDIASGRYDLNVAFNSGSQAFGKIALPLVIDAWDGKKFNISGIALSNDIRPVGQGGLALDAALLDDRKILICRGLQVAPSGSNRFHEKEAAGAYIEIYAPSLLEPNPPAIAAALRVFDAKTREKKFDSGFLNMAPLIQPGNPVIPVLLGIPMDSLPPGSYWVEMNAGEAEGSASLIRQAVFEIEAAPK